MKDFEKAFIQYASQQIKAVNAKLIIAKAREIYPNYKDISLNGEMKDENGEIVKFGYVLGGKVRAIRNGEPVLTISDFKTYEIWRDAFFGQDYYNDAKVECESSGISVEVFNDSDSKIKRKKYFVKNEEIDAAKFDRTNCNKYSNFAYLMKILYDKGKTEYQKVQDKQATENTKQTIKIIRDKSDFNRRYTNIPSVGFEQLIIAYGLKLNDSIVFYDKDEDFSREYTIIEVELNEEVKSITEGYAKAFLGKKRDGYVFLCKDLGGNVKDVKDSVYVEIYYGLRRNYEYTEKPYKYANHWFQIQREERDFKTLIDAENYLSISKKNKTENIRGINYEYIIKKNNAERFEVLKKPVFVGAQDKQATGLKKEVVREYRNGTKTMGYKFDSGYSAMLFINSKIETPYKIKNYIDLAAQHFIDKKTGDKYRFPYANEFYSSQEDFNQIVYRKFWVSVESPTKSNPTPQIPSIQATEKQPYEMTFEEWKEKFYSNRIVDVKKHKKGLVLNFHNSKLDIVESHFFDEKEYDKQKIRRNSFRLDDSNYLLEILYNRQKTNHHIKALKALRFEEPTSDKFRLVPTENGYKAVRGLGSVSEREQEFENLMELVSQMTFKEFQANTTIERRTDNQQQTNLLLNGKVIYQGLSSSYKIDDKGGNLDKNWSGFRRVDETRWIFLNKWTTPQKVKEAVYYYKKKAYFDLLKECINTMNFKISNEILNQFEFLSNLSKEKVIRNAKKCWNTLNRLRF